MTTKTKTENAIDYIAKQGAARSTDIGEAANITANQVCSTLYPYVRGGVLVSCRVEQPGKPSCNEYRLATGVTAQNWRNFKVGIFSASAVPKTPPVRSLPSEKKSPQQKQVLPPTHMSADQPQVSDKNSGSTLAENSSLAATERAVTVAKPHRKASQPAPGAGGHVTAIAARNIPDNIPDPVIPKFGYFSDGSIELSHGEQYIELDAVAAKRLADFLMNCMISAEVNA